VGEVRRVCDALRTHERDGPDAILMISSRTRQIANLCLTLPQAF
jgi:hypothetical protein